MKKLFLTLALLVSALAAQAATYTATANSPGAVQAAMNLATQPGDIVVIPSTDATWSSGVSWNMPSGSTLKGGGDGSTGGGNFTIIRDGVSGGGSLLSLTLPPSGSSRMTGITFRSGGGGTKDGGTIFLGGSSRKIRIDHCTFNFTQNANYQIIRVGGGVWGVMDHCIFDNGHLMSLFIVNGRGGNGLNEEWSYQSEHGSDKFWFVEDSIIQANSGGFCCNPSTWTARLYDSLSAGRVVARFNTVQNAVIGETHATGHAGDDRGTRSHEIYGNLSTATAPHSPPFTMDDLGSGTAMVWGNSFDQAYKNVFLIKNARQDNDPYFQPAPPSGWGFAGSEYNGSTSVWDGNQNATTGYPVLDQVGRGQGDLLANDFPNKINTAFGVRAWPRQLQEPVYFWDNTGVQHPGWGGSYIANSTSGRVQADRDYYTQASGIQTSPSSPFNGTTGTGWGTLANRPVNCNPGVGYWATDQGSWNTSSSNPYGVQRNGADGVFYKATAVNTWTLYYTPHTYPHPLQGGAPPVDNSAPTVSSVSVSANGTTWSISFNETVVFGAGGSGGFVPTMSGGPVTLTYSSGSGSGTLVYTGNRPLAFGETGTIAFTQNGSGIQDTSANLLASFSGTTVVNNTSSGDVTPPLLSSATVAANGTNWTLVFSENVGFGAGGNGGFVPTMGGGEAVNLSYFSGSGSSTLTYRGNRVIKIIETGTLAYTQPGNGIEDVNLNDLQSFTLTNIVNNSTVPDSNSPVVLNISIDTTGTNWSIVLSEACQFGAGGNGGFVPTMTGGAVTLTYASGAVGDTLIYTGSRVVTNSETGTMAYTQPVAGVSDLEGFNLASFTGFPVTNNSTAGTDVTAPTLVNVRVTSDGVTWVFNYTEAITNQSTTTGHAVTMSGGACALTFLSMSGSSVFCTGSRTIANTETGTAAYTQPGTGFSDYKTNYVATYSGATVINESTQGTSDTTAPTLLTARITSDGLTWRFQYSENVGFGAGGQGGHTVSMDGGACTLTYLTGAGANLYYTGSRTVDFDEAGTASFTQTADRVQDTAGNDAASWGPTTVINESVQGSGSADTNVVAVPRPSIRITPRNP